MTPPLNRWGGGMFPLLIMPIITTRYCFATTSKTIFFKHSDLQILQQTKYGCGSQLRKNTPKCTL